MYQTKRLFLTFFSVLLIIFTVFGDKPCAERNKNYESLVCVCNATYCDEISKIVVQPPGSYVLYTSSRDGDRFKKKEGKMKKYNRSSPKYTTQDWFENIKIQLNIEHNTEEIILYINRLERFQTIKGFGGAFSDAAGINFKKLSEKTKKNLITSYFTENGIEYNMGRVPIGGTDFSTRAYAYHMYPENDKDLTNFTLTEDDYEYKIPFIEMAQKAANYKLDLMAAAWSPPTWMKTTHKFGGVSFLKEEYYQTWADYHLKFLEEYLRHNISFWGISTGNEPANGVTSVRNFNSLGWLPHSQAKWVAENFGPTIKNRKEFKNIKMLTLDDNRFTLPLWIGSMSANPIAMDYIDGIGVHWYLNKIFPNGLSEITHSFFKDKFLIATEACTGVYEVVSDGPIFGAWYRAEMYIEDIIDDLHHWFVGWLDWNLMLDEHGGPNWYENYADACIITLPEKDEFIKQPIFYIMGHFSKFIPKGSVRVTIDQVSGASIEKVAFLRPDGGIVVIFYNRYSYFHEISIRERNIGQVSITVHPKSIHSLIYW